ncbi:hypothetical protein PGTUg99_019073 [Puccinia graminis f. sp. tritici]|uniref:Uncharacterized protein n=1 Tax=Puccinia graminis f. sp. tritici TaxID=56615 RepID=A0A5B0LSA1_PUCGR|nr:hypothetical protein PGTUg99_019073 [Puccinia graminis f. sp. tritici]
MVDWNPDIRVDADIRLLFPAICASAPASAPAGGYPSAAAGIRAGILGYPPSKGPAGRASFQPARYKYRVDRKGVLPVDEVPVPRRPEGVSFQSTRYLYLDGWKEALPRYKYLVDRKGVLPVDKVPVPRRPEGCPSSRRGTCTSPAGRVSFQSTRYLYLDGWKEALPAIKVQVPRQLEGDPSSRPFPLPATGILWDTRQLLAEKGPSAPESAPVGGYPLALASIRQRIAGIRDGYPSTISKLQSRCYAAGLDKGVYYISLFDLIYFSLSALSNPKDNSSRVLVLASIIIPVFHHD